MFQAFANTFFLMHTHKRTLHRSIGSKGHSGTSAGHRHKSLFTEDRCGREKYKGPHTVALIHCNCHITVENSQACSPLRLQIAQRMLKLQLVEVKTGRTRSALNNYIIKLGQRIDSGFVFSQG